MRLKSLRRRTVKQIAVIVSPVVRTGVVVAVAALDRLAATSLADDRERGPLPRTTPVARVEHEVGIAAVVPVDRVADADRRAARKPHLRAS